MLPTHPLLKAQERANAAAARRQAAATATSPSGSAAPAATAAPPGSAASAVPARLHPASVTATAHNEGTAANWADCKAIALQVGGEGVSRSELTRNLDQSAPRGRNPQLAEPVAAVAVSLSGGVAGAAGTVIAADAASLASPSGELEGDSKVRQDGLVADVSNRLESGWPEEAEGVVGATGRNKFYCDVRVGDRWSKLEKGGLNLWRGETVLVKLKWVSGDGRDAEYEVVRRLDTDRQQPGQPLQAPPVGFEGQGNVGVSHQEPVKAKEQVFLTAPPQSMGFQQLPVPVIHDQPKVVVFQTTTMEQIVAKEQVGTLHASGKTGPAPRMDDYRSPVLDDVAQARPAEDGPAATDFMERARAEAYEAYLRQPFTD